ncbi:HNH endonuclease [Leptolyngbya iicbica]|uniref:HNH endonuclease n=1 Tax=Leptolyngbya iicbica LK TaxID=2294035 RepID=A0A4Q7E9N2_9CYAN|nr:HNH endonuclease [Leptolyngbya sp. LK]RZM79144.1 HNH endonuclease [Leptolyngbya sp. LK]
MDKDLGYYAHRFRTLRVNINRGVTPYQPLLLLSVIELIGQNYIQENKIYLTPELVSLFVKYRSQLSPSHYQADLAQPFFFLSRVKNAFWHLKAKEGKEAVLDSGTRLNSVPLLRRNIDFAFLDEDLFDYLKSPISKNVLVSTLVEKWFADQLKRVEKLIGVNPFDHISYSDFDPGIERQLPLASELDVNSYKNAIEAVRDTTFRKNIVRLYDSRCAFCHLRIISLDETNIVDGAHIKPFSKFKDDTYSNGISLCKNHHWAFDHGWFGIDENYRILIRQNWLTESASQGTKLMREYHGEGIILPHEDEFLPDLGALEWHRQHWKIA